MEYIGLQQLIKKRGLLDTTPTYYVRITLELLVAFTVFWILYYTTEHLLFQFIDVLILGFVSMHFGFLGHDAAHNAISKKRWVNDLFGHICLTLVNGISLLHWQYKHNAHHKDPNFDPGDPDIEQIFAYDEHQAKRRKGFLKWITKHQVAFFVPLHAVSVFDMTCSSFRYLFKRYTGKGKIMELCWMLLHFALWVAIPGIFVGFGKAIMLYFVATIIRSLYSSMVFVPNHVGMPILSPKAKLSYFQKQLLATRNITPSWFKDFFFGGLNYQIEHHLFPSMSRKNLATCKAIVKEYVEKIKMPYKEVGFFACYKEVFSHMYNVSKAAV